MDTSLRYTFQLKRVGKPATVLGVKDIMKIHKDVTRFGRHSENDYFLDSAEYLCLVSRWHAELHRVEQEGKIQYMLRDNSLNGTYVNDVRVKGNQVLQENDIIMFGHPNGKNIKPGQEVSPLLSEFSFVFQQSSPPSQQNSTTLTLNPAHSFASSNTAFTKVGNSHQLVSKNSNDDNTVICTSDNIVTCNNTSSVTFDLRALDDGDLNLSGSRSGKLTSDVDPLLSVPGSPVISRAAPSVATLSPCINIIQSQTLNNNNNTSLVNKNTNDYIPAVTSAASDESRTAVANRSVMLDYTGSSSSSVEGLRLLQRSLSCQETPSGDAPAKRTSSGVNRRILSDSDCLGMSSGSGEGTMLVLKDISNASLKKAPGLVHLDQLFTSHGTVSPGRIKPPLARSKKSDSEDESSVFAMAAKNASRFRTATDSDEDLFDSFKPLNPAVPPTVPSTKATTSLLSQLDSAMTSTVCGSSGSTSQQKLALLQNPSQTSIIAANYNGDLNIGCNNSVIVRPCPSNRIKPEHTSSPLLSKNSTSPVFQTVNIKDVSDQQFIPISSAITPKSQQRAGISSPSISKSPMMHQGLFNEQPTSRSANTTPSRGVKRPHSATPSREDTPTGGKKRRRKGKRWTQIKKRLNAAGGMTEEEEKFHYDGDPCDSADCYRPAGNKVSWVQCDDCDSWYHTVCAGTTFDMVNNDNAEFHCGCM